jgi:hypothetical protein
MKLTELRKLAEAAQKASPAHGVVISGRKITELSIAVDRFHNAANPATILALLDLIAQCKEALEYAADESKPVGIYGCECPICTSLASIERFEGEKK